MPQHAPDPLARDPESIAQWIMASCAPAKADAVARILTQRLAILRAGTYDMALARVARPSAYCADKESALGLPGPRTRSPPRPE